MSSTTTTLAQAAGLAAAAAVVGYYSLRPRTLGRPLPGPRGLPLIGNLNDIAKPGEREWEVYIKLTDKYGPIVQLSVPGFTLVILDDPEDVKQLFWTRNAHYSGRISFPMLELVGLGNATGSMPLGDEFRARRRLMNKMLGSTAVGDGFCRDIQTAEVVKLLKDLVSEEVGVCEGLKHMTASVITQLCYGYTPKTTDDHFVTISDQSLSIFLNALDPTWLVNLIPFARHLPDWIPGMGWKRVIQENLKIVTAADYEPFNWARAQLDAGTAVPSFTQRYLTDPDDAVDSELLRNTLSALYAAASDTIQALSQSMFVALALHPDAQARAQAEIDAVTHGQRLPTLTDRDSLPFVDALLLEITRWKSTVNIGLPHVAAQDDEYKGYHIPKGAIIFPNVWRILHDPRKYPNPDVFNPDRFLNVKADAENRAPLQPDLVNEDPRHYTFGFGLRQCPGRHLADSTSWLLLAHVLATVDVREVRRPDGSLITLDNLENPLPAPVSHPNLGSCKVEWRSPRVEALLEAEL